MELHSVLCIYILFSWFGIFVGLLTVGVEMSLTLLSGCGILDMRVCAKSYCTLLVWVQVTSLEASSFLKGRQEEWIWGRQEVWWKTVTSGGRGNWSQDGVYKIWIKKKSHARHAEIDFKYKITLVCLTYSLVIHLFYTASFPVGHVIPCVKGHCWHSGRC